MWFFKKKTIVEKGNIIVIGAGEVGFNIASRLAHEDRKVVVIDQNEESLRRVAEHMDVQVILGSGASPKVLEEAGITDDSILLAVTDCDEVNIIASLIVNHIAPKAQKIARVRNEEFSKYTALFEGSSLGISMVINPDLEVVHSINRIISLPGAIEAGEFVSGKIKMVAMIVDKGPLIGQPLKNFTKLTGAEALLISVIVRDEELIIPYGETVIQKDDLVYFIYTDETRTALLNVLEREERTIHNVMIFGGGDIGLHLARFFEKKNYHVRLIEKDIKRCEFLSSVLDTTIVLHGGGTDHDLLRDENVAKMDVVVAATGDEEYNILTCLLAKSLGAKETVSRIDRAIYQNLSETIGVDHTVSPRLAAVNSILRYVRQGKVLSSLSLRGDDAEIMEVVALKNSKVVNKPIMELGLPKGILFLAIIRAGEVYIPKGTFIIHPHDRVILLSTRAAMGRMEEALMEEKFIEEKFIEADTPQKKNGQPETAVSKIVALADNKQAEAAQLEKDSPKKVAE